MKAVRQLSPIHRMAPWIRTYGSYQGRECSTRPCHGSGYAHSALEHSQLTYGYAIGMSGMQLLRCWYCAIPGPCPTPPGLHLFLTCTILWSYVMFSHAHDVREAIDDYWDPHSCCQHVCPRKAIVDVLAWSCRRRVAFVSAP